MTVRRAHGTAAKSGRLLVVEGCPVDELPAGHAGRTVFTRATVARTSAEQPTNPQRIPNPPFRGLSPEESGGLGVRVGQKGGPGQAAATLDSRLCQPTLSVAKQQENSANGVQTGRQSDPGNWILEGDPMIPSTWEVRP